MADENPNVSGVAGRYATALFELAREERTVDFVKADLDRFDAMIAESADLARLVRSPVFTVGGAGQGADRAARQGRHRRHLGEIPEIAGRQPPPVRRSRDVIRTFRTLVAHFKGEATAEVTVAEQLSDRNLDALKSAR